MSYVDGFVLVVPKKKLKAYRAMARLGAQVWKRCGALDYFECMGDDLHPKHAVLTFPKLVKLKPGETVWFSFIVFKSRAHRDRVNAKVMKDPVLTSPRNRKLPMPFDLKRMAYGGFKCIVRG
ncbi:MAG: DUF1428 domain-containing protein [Myxococcota bacterium]